MRQADNYRYIHNWRELTGHGSTELRRSALDIVEHALWAADPYVAVRRLLQRDGDILRIGDLTLDLDRYERVFVLGAGKASRGIAKALEEVLGDRIVDGVFVLKKGDSVNLEHINVIYAGHPIPDEDSVRGAMALMRLTEGLTERDLVFAGITGGSSALLALPAEGISLEDLQEVNRILLTCGADIFQINAVRKHLSRIKGGRLAERILPATLINLTVSDVVGDQLDYITGPTVPDTSTFDDARAVLDAFGLWDAFPPAAAEWLRRGGEEWETPKDFEGLPLYSFVVVPGDAACRGALERARALGFNALILTSMLEGEAKDAGLFFASIAKEILTHGRPFARPCAIIAGGENVVTVDRDAKGEGGPNQEFALAAAIGIARLSEVAVVSIDTDGSDGISEFAGGLVDGNTQSAAEEVGLDPFRGLRDHDAAGVLRAVGDGIVTGATGTNVNDLKVLLVA